MLAKASVSAWPQSISGSSCSNARRRRWMLRSSLRFGVNPSGKVQSASFSARSSSRETGTARGSAGSGGGSIIVLVATDAPLLPHQLDRLAQRAGLGIARLGGAGENGSGDIFIAFSTANRGLAGGGTRSVEMLGNDAIDPLFYATIEATEEAIVNAMLQAETMTGKAGATAYRLEPELLADLMRGPGAA